MPDASVLNVLLHGKQIGTLTLLPDDRTLFAFTNEYIDDDERDVLSLSFKDVYGTLDAETKPTRVRVPTFFSNLLPEGHLRNYLAERAGVHQDREFFLLWILGRDLPGAIEIVPTDRDSLPKDAKGGKEKGDSTSLADDALRFSLAGVQLKFSALKSARGGLTIPANGVGGSWIVKLPSTAHAGVPENEFAMMELARRVGIEVPETALVPVEKIAGLPDGIGNTGAKAFIIKRFDRLDNGTRVHIEDFAQIFGFYPDKKYSGTNYDAIASVLAAETGDAGVTEFIRRFTFNALIGNGDMHLKNWSVIYPDKRKAGLSPAYDFVSTLTYVPNEKLALNFAGSKAFTDLSYDQFERFAAKAKLSASLVKETARATVDRFKTVWGKADDLSIEKPIKDAIDAHLKTLPIAK